MATVESPLPTDTDTPEGAPVACRFYSVSQAAALLGVSRGTIRRWIGAGKLPASRLGHRMTRIKREDLGRLLIPHRTPAAHAHVNDIRSRVIGVEHRPAATAGAPTHVVQFYDADAALVDAVGEFIGTALLAGDAGIVVATEAHRAGVEQRLRSAGVDVTAASTAGRYLALDAAETLARFTVDGLPDPARFAAIVGGIITSAADDRPVRIFGEMVALLALDGNHQGAVLLEALWNDLQQTHPFSLLCAYPMTRLGGEACADLFNDVCAEHDHVIPAESYTALGSSAERLRAVAVLQQKAQSLEVALEAERSARVAAQTALRLRDEFLAMASHELKTPMTSLRGYVQLLDRRLGRRVEETGQPLLSKIDGQVRAMSDLIDELLDVSRIEAGKLVIHRDLFDLDTLLRETVDVLQENLTRHAIVVETSGACGVIADRDRIGQVLLNVLTNAARYAPPETEIRCGIAAGDGDEILLWVRDAGIGIAPEESERIFERFYQVVDTDRRPCVGMGVGLYIARQIMEKHGGRIWVESVPGAGSTFWMALPR